QRPKNRVPCQPHTLRQPRVGTVAHSETVNMPDITFHRVLAPGIGGVKIPKAMVSRDAFVVCIGIALRPAQMRRLLPQTLAKRQTGLLQVGMETFVLFLLRIAQKIPPLVGVRMAVYFK